MDQPKFIHDNNSRVYPVGALIPASRKKPHPADGDTAKQWLYGDGVSIIGYSNGEEVYHG